MQPKNAIALTYIRRLGKKKIKREGTGLFPCFWPRSGAAAVVFQQNTKN